MAAVAADRTVIGPQPGPQSAFLSSPADICFYGGNAGGGKSYALLLDQVRWKDVPGFAGIILRRTSPELTGGGSLWEKAQEIFGHTDGVSREGKELDWRWPSGAQIQFRHLVLEKTKYDHQGKEYAVIGFDEVTHFSESQFWYLYSRNRSTCGVKPYIRATCNPDPDSWVRGFIDWWIDDDGYAIPERSGVLRYFLRVDDVVQWADTAEELEDRYPHLTRDLPANENGDRPRPTSVTFIPSKLSDNPALENADPLYRAKLLALPRVERERLLGVDERGANWNIRPASGLYFNRAMFQVIDAPANSRSIDGEKVVRRARGWDLAATAVTPETPDPDYTASVKLALLADGRLVVEHMSEMRGSPAAVRNAVKNLASQDGSKVVIGFWQDPGQAGKDQAQGLVRMLRGYRARTKPAAKNKVKYAEPFSAQCEAGNVLLLRGDWNERFYSVFEAFPDGGHDDAVDASSRAFLEVNSKSARWIADMEAAAERAN